MASAASRTRFSRTTTRAVSVRCAAMSRARWVRATRRRATRSAVRSMLVGNIELTFPLPGTGYDRTLRVFTFLDGGNVWGNEGNSIGANGLRYAYGVGLAWISPIGPLKLSLGFPLVEARRRPVPEIPVPDRDGVLSLEASTCQKGQPWAALIFSPKIVLQGIDVCPGLRWPFFTPTGSRAGAVFAWCATPRTRAPLAASVQ